MKYNGMNYYFQRMHVTRHLKVEVLDFYIVKLPVERCETEFKVSNTKVKFK